MNQGDIVTSAGFYMDGFFGYSGTTDFTWFSPAHIIPIIILVASVILLWLFRDKIRSFKNEKRIMFIIGLILLFVEMSYFWRIMYVGQSWYSDTDLMSFLPLQVCEWTCIFAAIMMLSGNRTCFCICYYCSMTFSWFALLLPTVIDCTGPGYFRYYQFWLEHLLPMFAVFYMMFIHGYSVKIRDVIKPLIFLICLLIPAEVMNANCGTNYMYIVPGAEGDPFYGVLPDTVPLRILTYVIITFMIFAVVWIPMHINRKRLNSIAELSPLNKN